MHRPRTVTVAGFAALTVLALAPAASADTPDIAAGALTAACDAAKALDQCPECTCQLVTQTSPDVKLDPAMETTIPVGAVMQVSGERMGGEYQAAHIVLGTLTSLEHVGRIAETSQLGPSQVTYTVDGLSQAVQWCAGGCQYEAVGLIHPFVVTTTRTDPDMESPQDTVTEEKRLALCFDGLGGLSCGTVPLALEKRVTVPGATPEARRKVLSREGYERTWKLGKAGDVAFGKATGKRAKDLQRPEKHNVSLVELYGQPDAKPLVRY